MPNRKSLYVITFFALILLVGALGIFARRTPVLFRVSGNVDEQHALFILNPFRDRSPEHEAEKVLSAVSAGRCNEIALQLWGKTDPKCGRDTELHIRSWRLLAREDEGKDDVRILYEVRRESGTGEVLPDPYWFHVKKDENGRWRVATLERWF